MSNYSNQFMQHERDLLDALKKEPAYASRSITFGYLACDELLENGEVTFPILSADDSKLTPSKNVTERRLQLNEVFVPTRLKLTLRKVVSQNYAQSKEWTYPNPVEFAGNGSTFLEADLWAIWKGSMSMQYQTTKYEPGIEVSRFLAAPEIQYGQKLTDTQSTPIVTTLTNSPVSHEHMGEVLLHSFPHLFGNVSQEVKLSIPNASNLKMKCLTSGTDYVLRLTMRGFMIQNKA